MKSLPPLEQKGRPKIMGMFVRLQSAGSNVILYKQRIEIHKLKNSPIKERSRLLGEKIKRLNSKI